MSNDLNDNSNKQPSKKTIKVQRFIRVITGGLVVPEGLLEVRESKIDHEFGYFHKYYKGIVEYGGTNEAENLHGRKTALEEARDKAEKLKSDKERDRALEQVKIDARRLVNDANIQFYGFKDAAEARTAIDRRLASLEDNDRDFKKIDASGKNPVTGLLTEFDRQRREADEIKVAAERKKEYVRIAEEIEQQTNKCWECKAARLEAQRAIQAATTLCETLQAGFGANFGNQGLAATRNQLLMELTTCTTNIGKAFADAPDLDAVKAQLGIVVVDANHIAVTVNQKRVELANLKGLKGSVEANLQEAQQAIAQIVDDSTRSPLEEALQRLRDQQVGGNQINDEAVAKPTLFTLDKDAMKLLEDAKKAAFMEKAATPEGCQEIDQEIASFGDLSNNPRKLAICKVALEARFKLTVEIPEGLSVTRLPLLFKMFALVPAEHVGHDMLTRLELGTEPASNANFYSSTNKKIVLEPKIDRDLNSNYERQDGTGAKETLKYFTSTTLHEIGHGVDFKFTVMADHQKSPGCGQWRSESLDSVITAYYDAFFQQYVGVGKSPLEADLRQMLRLLLTTGRCAKPNGAADPLGSLFADWDAISAEPAFTTYCPAIRVDSDPWRQKHAAGTRVYLESYSNNWWSYLADERQGGISSYQWRAPHEWFAEVYALWHLKQIQAFPESIAEFVKGKNKG